MASWVMPMKRKIRTYGGYFEAFMETLKEKEQEKIQYYADKQSQNR